MAQVKGAFGGLKTKGSIADTYTFQNWKGINVVKSKPYPSNPQSTDQTSNRDQFKEAVDYWHDSRTTARDKKAWGLAAQLSGRPMSGFNRLVSRIRFHTIANTWALLYKCEMILFPGQVQPQITCARACNVTFSIIRGPNAGYSETLAVAAGSAKSFAKIDINQNDICMWYTGPTPNIGESGNVRAVEGGF